MNILVSACLLGVECRYDGTGKEMVGLKALMKEYHLIPVCPEQLGGLPTPRLPSERSGERVLMCDGTDVTDRYRQGAEETLRLAKRCGCRIAVLKRKSPSCGSGEIYDGSFTRTLVPGWGVTAQLLRENGIAVYDETQLEQLAAQILKKT